MSLRRIKKQLPGNITTEQNAAQLLRTERDERVSTSKVTQSVNIQKGKPTPEAFDNLNAVTPDEGKIFLPSERQDLFQRTSGFSVNQTKTLPQGAIVTPTITNLESREKTNIITLQKDRRAQDSTSREADFIKDIDSFFINSGFNPGSNNINVVASTSSVTNSEQKIQDETNQETINASLKNLQIEDNPLTKFDNVTYNFRLFMTGETAVSSTLANEDIVVIAETGSTGFNITDVNIKTIISPSLITRNSYATNLKITIIEPHGNSLIDRMKNAADSLGVIDHKDIPLWFTISFKGYTQGQNNSQNSYDGGNPTDEMSEETRIWRIKIRRVEAEIDKGGTEYIITAIPLNEQGMGDAARRLEKDEQIDALTLGEFFKELSKRLNAYENFSTAAIKARDITKRVRKYGFSLPRGDELDFSKINNVPQINDMDTWEIRGENIAENKRTESFIDGKRKWRITFGAGTAIEAIIQEIIGTTVEGQSLALYGEKRGNTEDIKPTEHREPTKPSIIFTVDPTVDITSYNGVARTYNTLIVYHIRPYLTFQPILSREQIEDSLEARKSKERLTKQLKVTNIRKKYEYMFTGLNTEILDYKIKFDRTWFLSLPIFQGQNRNAVGISSGFINLDKSQLRILQEADARDNSTQSLRSGALAEIAQIERDLSKISDPLHAAPLIARRREAQTELRKIDITAMEDDFATSAALSQANERTAQAVRTGARRIDTSTFGAGIINLENNIQSPGSNINLLLESDIIISNDDRKLVNEVKDRLRSKQNVRGSIFFAEDLDRLEQGTVGPDTSKSENQAHNNVPTEISPTINPIESSIEGTISKGRSFFSSVMNQVYGQKGQMRMIEMTIRGDPYWLGEPDVIKRLTVSSANSRDITRSDSLIILTFAFPNEINDGGDNRADSSEGTGLYNINRKENGFNGIYYIRRVESHFSNGKFTQRLIGHADILTQESDVINAAINLSNT